MKIHVSLLVWNVIEIVFDEVRLHKSLWPQKLEGLDQQEVCDYDTLQVLYNPSKNSLFVFKLKLPIQFVKNLPEW